MTDSLDIAQPAPARGAVRLWLVVFAAAAVLYLLTAQRGPGWQDSGIFQWRIHTSDLTGWLGLALAHPVLMLVGRVARAIPIGSEAWRLNALSGLAGAVAAANLALLVRRLAPKVPSAALLAAGAFGLAHTVWWLATITESHTMLAAIISGELLVLLSLLNRPRLSRVVLLGLLNGLGMATHNLAMLALPAYGLAVVWLAWRRKLPWSAVGLFVLAWLAGAAPLLALTVVEANRTGLAAAVTSTLFGSQWQGAVLGSAWRRVPAGLGYIVYNFPNLTLPLAAVGLWRLRRRVGGPMAAALAYITVVHFLFAVRYRVTDQFMFFVPLYLMLTLAAGLGLAELATKRRWLPAVAGALLAAGPMAYAVMPSVLRAVDVSLPAGRTLPHRDDARYWLTPWKHDENSAGQFAAAALDQLADENAPVVLVADGTAYWPLRWALAAEDAPPVRLIGPSSGQPADELGRDPATWLAEIDRKGGSVWVVSNVEGYCPAPLLPYVDDEPTGVLYRVRLPE